MPKDRTNSWIFDFRYCFAPLPSTYTGALSCHNRKSGRTEGMRQLFSLTGVRFAMIVGGKREDAVRRRAGCPDKRRIAGACGARASMIFRMNVSESVLHKGCPPKPCVGQKQEMAGSPSNCHRLTLAAFRRIRSAMRPTASGVNNCSNRYSGSFFAKG